MHSRNSALQSLRIIRSGAVEVLCIVDAEKTQEVQDAMRVITRASKTPIALSLVDVSTGLPVRRFASGADAPGRKESRRG